jgi:hypothetical protein
VHSLYCVVIWRVEINRRNQDDAIDSIEDLELATECLALYRIFNQPLRHLSWERSKSLLVQCPLCGHARSKFEPQSIPLQFVSELHRAIEKTHLSKCKWPWSRRLILLIDVDCLHLFTIFKYCSCRIYACLWLPVCQWWFERRTRNHVVSETVLHLTGRVGIVYRCAPLSTLTL